MKFIYDLHIHSGLSPCADNDMTPVNILATASALGLNFIAISDHNAIANVKLAMEIGKLLDIVVVPAMELQTNEDIHLLCLFPTYERLEEYYNSIRFTSLKNREEIFGEQLIFDEDDNVVAKEPSLLLTSAFISECDAAERAALLDGVAVPAHIDRDANGMFSVLGAIPDNYKSVEISCDDESALFRFDGQRKTIFDSDAHTLADVGKKRNTLELDDFCADALIKYLK